MMRVIKRNGETEEVSFDKVLNRIKKISDNLNVNVFDIAQKVCSRIYDNVKTSELDEFAANICSSMITEHPDYGALGARIIVSNHHKNTSPSFSETINTLYNNIDIHGDKNPLVSDEIYEIVMKNKEKLNSYLKYERDYLFDYFGFKTLERSYLLKVNGVVVERPQQMWMRVALGIHGNDIKEALNTYDLMSQKYFTHATPTLFNAGTPRPQLSSCFVKGTMVYTKRGAIPIEQVKIGDEVMTHKSRFQKVSQIHINTLGERNLFDFKAYLTPKITATDNHSFMSITNEQMQWGHLPQWNTLDKLRIGDYIEIPAYTEGEDKAVIDISYEIVDILDDGNNITYSYEVNDEYIRCFSNWQRPANLRNVHGILDFKKEMNTLKRFWNVDSNFCKFLGVWYGDGHIIKTKNSAGVPVPKGIGITIDENNCDLIEFCKTYGENTFGVNASMHYMKNQNVCQVLFNSVTLGYIFKNMFGEYYHSKKLYKGFNEWNVTLIESLLCGLVCSDGFVTKEGMVRVGMCNPKFLRDVYNLARSRGILVSYVEGVKKYESKYDGIKENVIAYMTIPRESAYLNKVSKTYTDDRIQKYHQKVSNHSSTISINGRKFVRIMEKEPSKRSDTTVYNLGVENDHSYMVDGIIAKNCFLVALKEDSVAGIFQTLEECAKISKYAGGIGVHVHNVRGKGSRIRGTNGQSDGIVPMLRVYNNTARYINQSGKRNGSIAVYLEPWHCDVEPFLEMKKNHGNEEERARDLFYALWIPDLFMERVKNDMMWSLMCPDECPGLSEVYGDEFVSLYEKYEKEGRYKKQVRAQDLWWQVLQAQIEQGTPYLLFKDAVNKKTNQKNLGTIKSSNLCSEICEFSSADETAVCNLSSIALPSYIEYDENNKPFFNFQKLHEVAKIITKNLNKVIDVNFYPVETARRSNLKHRPIGIGVQGLADAYIMMRYPFDSPEAMRLNKDIFETIYHGAMESSMEISKKRAEYIEMYNKEQITYDELDEKIKMNEYEIINTKYPGAYSTFEGSPASQGVFQFDLWGVTPDSGMYDWNKLKNEVMTYGIRNSLLLAPMPTASTSQILGFNEAFEPYTSNFYKRKTLAGEFIIVNKHMINDLVKLGLWNKEMKDKLMITEGSIQSFPEVPDDLKALYKTSWELRQKVLIDQSADRGAFVCQSQSLNLFVEDPDFKKLSSMHFYSWQKGLKTGMYYLRTRAKAQAQKFTVDPKLVRLTNLKGLENNNASSSNMPKPKTVVCDGDACVYCSG